MVVILTSIILDKYYKLYVFPIPVGPYIIIGNNASNLMNINDNFLKISKVIYFLVNSVFKLSFIPLFSISSDS